MATMKTAIKELLEEAEKAKAKKPALYLISYDLNIEKDYPKLIGELKERNAQHMLGSVPVIAESTAETMRCPRCAPNGKLTKSTRIQAVTALVSTRPNHVSTP